MCLSSDRRSLYLIRLYGDDAQFMEEGREKKGFWREREGWRQREAGVREMDDGNRVMEMKGGVERGRQGKEGGIRKYPFLMTPGQI